jgi:chorismate dehydratase
MKYAPKAGYFVYDLGELWLEKSGFPIVFAAFAAQRAAVEQYHDEIQSIVLSFFRSLACLETDKPGLILAAEKKYPDIQYDLDAYYDYLKFYFTDRLKQALDFYCASAAELGLLTLPRPFEFLP